MKTLLLVDGSSYLYRAFHALPDLKNKEIHGFLKALNKIMTDFNPKHIGVVFDAKGKNFRHKLYDQYKANRPRMPEELAIQIDPLKKAISAMGWPMMIPDVEADDVIGEFIKKSKC